MVIGGLAVACEAMDHYREPTRIERAEGRTRTSMADHDVCLGERTEQRMGRHVGNWRDGQVTYVGRPSLPNNFDIDIQFSCQCSAWSQQRHQIFYHPPKWVLGGRARGDDRLDWPPLGRLCRHRGVRVKDAASI